MGRLSTTECTYLPTYLTAPWHVVCGVGGGVDSAVGVGDAGVADGEGVIGDTWWLACLVVV